MIAVECLLRHCYTAPLSMVPERFCPAFSAATLKTLEAQRARLVVADPLFFRSAYTANVTENARRTFAPVVVLNPAGIASARCTCSPELKPDDLCRHVAALLARSSDDGGALLAERFESSLWRAVGFELFGERRELEISGAADPRELLLRKLTMTAQEQMLLKRGAASTRLLWEDSAWHRWAKAMFSRFGEGEGARLEQREGGFHLVAGDGSVALPPGAVEHVLAARGGAIAAASGFDVAPKSLIPSLRIELTPERALRFIPVLLAGKKVHVRDTLPRFGRFFLLPAPAERRESAVVRAGRFASAAAASPMFAERGTAAQSSLFDVRPSSGLPLDRETLIAEEHAFAFIESHREELARLPASLAPDVVRNAQPHRLDGEVVFDFSPAAGNLLEVDIVFEAGGETVHGGKLAQARRAGVRALVRGNIWIDVADAQLEFLDSATMGPRGHVLVTRLELLRIRGSLRGRAVFRGDPSCEQIFRMFDELLAPAPVTRRRPRRSA